MHTAPFRIMCVMVVFGFLAAGAAVARTAANVSREPDTLLPSTGTEEVMVQSGSGDKSGEGEAVEGEIPEGEAAEGEMPEGEAPEGEAAEGEAPEGEAAEGELVEATIVTPRVVHETFETARDLIESNSLSLGEVSYECNNMLSEGIVLRQSPAPGAYVAEQAPVDLVVSTGRCPLGCDSYELSDWGMVFLGALALLVLLTLGLFIGEGRFVNPFDILR